MKRRAAVSVAYLALALLAAGCAAEVPRETAGAQVHRSVAARRAFQREVPCPATGRRTGACPGWVVDHVLPLACGGADAPGNMQWQTREDARAKDRWERKAPGCR